MTTVLVLGATGRTGRHVVDGLLAAGADVRALVRSPPDAALPPQVTVVEGSLQQLDAVGRAAAGADAAYLLWPGFATAGAAEVVTEVARHARHLVHLSAAQLQGDSDGATPGVWADVEQLVRDSGSTWTFVRGGGFAANTLEWAAQIRAGDTVTLPFPSAARSLVHERDLADVAVRALLDPSLAGRAFAITGPETLTQHAQVAAIGAAIGRRLHVVEQSRDDAVHGLTELFGDRAYAESAVGYWASLVDAPERVSPDVGRVLGRPALTFARWAADHAADFA